MNNPSESTPEIETESIEPNHSMHQNDLNYSENNILAMPLEEPLMNDISDEKQFEETETPQEAMTPQEAEAPTNETESPNENEKQSAHKQHFDTFLSELKQRTDVDSKLQFAIDFMETSLSQAGTPHFKSFWEARTICLELFKENVSPLLRTMLWNKYNELSKEARRLKDILDEQSAFAVEQIEIAVKALEDDIAAFEEQAQKSPLVRFEVSSQVLGKRVPHYQDLQRKLNLLNTQASRINALRKELIRTEMRVRQKNKFFQRLSAAGDLVFPARKDLIKEVSQSFITDVDSFIQTYFENKDVQNSLFALREEIKALQNMAKLLTLNTHSFTHTRMRLSECWDRIKNEEKERKKERSQQKVVFKQNYETSMQKIAEFNEAYKTENWSSNEANKHLDELVTEIRSLELGRDELNALREEVGKSRKPILDKINAHEIERQNQDQERERQQRNKINELKMEIEDLLKNSSLLDSDALLSQRDAISDKISNSSMSKIEKLEFEKLLKPFKDLILEKKESALLSLSADDRQSLLQLREVLKQRKERRQEVKDQIDVLRKQSGTSGLGFEQAMNYNAQLAAEKERLEKINQGIKEVEVKIAELVDR